MEYIETSFLPVEQEALFVGLLAIDLYTHSKSACQWQTHYVSVTDKWEWYFFNERGGLDG